MIKLPNEIIFADIEAFDKIDERISAISCLFTNIVGVNEKTIEFCPDQDEPEEEIYLAWIWVNKPSLGQSFKDKCSSDFAKLIDAYDEESLDSWFEYMAT